MSEKLRELERGFDLKGYLETKSAVDRGNDWSLDCPSCAEDGKGDKLWVRVASELGRPAGAWTCYRCGESGHSVLHLIQFLDGESFGEAFKTLLEFDVGAPRVQDLRGAVEAALAAMSTPIDEAVDPAPTPLPAEFVPCGSGRLPSYFRERGIGPEQAAYYGLGFCSEGHYYNRLVVPVRSPGPLRRVEWFLARWMAKVPPEGVKKTLNSFGAKASRYLYELYRASNRGVAVLVEDVFSAMRVGPGGVATFGTHFSERQFALLAASEVESVVVMWDHDAIDKAWELAKNLSALWPVRVVELPDARDPDEYPRRALWGMVEAAAVLTGPETFSKSVASRLSRL